MGVGRGIIFSYEYWRNCRSGLPPIDYITNEMQTGVELTTLLIDLILIVFNFLADIVEVIDSRGSTNESRRCKKSNDHESREQPLVFGWLDEEHVPI
jgi:hypothetical protein